MKLLFRRSRQMRAIATLSSDLILQSTPIGSCTAFRQVIRELLVYSDDASTENAEVNSPLFRSNRFWLNI